MAEKAPIFTVDWEDWNDALHITGEPNIQAPTLHLLNILDRYEVKAIFYILGVTALAHEELFKEIQDSGHIIGWHGMNHYHNLEDNSYTPFRSPYWDKTPMPWPPSGGFFFRFMPYAYVKWAVKKSGVFWIHPHDIMLDHPPTGNFLLTLKRRWGLKGARAKLGRLLTEVQFGNPS